MRKFIPAAIAAAFIVPSTALATYGTQPGFGVANGNTICAGHGAFGAFGAHGDVVHDFGINNLGSNGAPGADGTQTGINNSSLCGNPQ
jgi:hypothetical protein